MTEMHDLWMLQTGRKSGHYTGLYACIGGHMDVNC